jgi:hypothetical protein
VTTTQPLPSSGRCLQRHYLTTDDVQLILKMLPSKWFICHNIYPKSTSMLSEVFTVMKNRIGSFGLGQGVAGDQHFWENRISSRKAFSKCLPTFREDMLSPPAVQGTFSILTARPFEILRNICNRT